MNVFQNILVVMDRRHERQLAWESSSLLARATGATLHAFLPAMVEEPPLKIGEGLEASLRHTAELEGERWLSDHLALEADKPAYQQHVAATHVWGEAVVHEARRVGADLVVVRVESAPDQHQWQWLLRHLPCPAYLLHKGGVPAKVAAAVSAGAEDEKHRVLNDAILENAVKFAGLWPAELSVISALPSPLEYAPLVGETYAVGYVEKELEDALKEGLVSSVARHGITKLQVFTGLGPAEEVLVQDAESRQIDCLVLGTVSRKALAALLLGNTAESVVRRVSCDILLLRPQDFEALQ